MRTELMVGDWVLCNGSPIQLNIGQLHNLVCDTEWAKRYKCEPIPLTKDMLKANGWHHHLSVNCHNHNWSLGDLWLTKDLELFVYKMHIKIKYVHQLQHVLRLVGMSDLANNFKIQ